MEKGVPQYTRLREDAAKGIYDLVDPLDYKLLEALTEEGTTLAGLYEIGTTVAQLRKEFPLTAGVLSIRMRMMEAQGLTRQIKAIGTKSSGNRAWQRTAKANEVLAAWKEKASA